MVQLLAISKSSLLQQLCTDCHVVLMLVDQSNPHPRGSTGQLWEWAAMALIEWLVL